MSRAILTDSGQPWADVRADLSAAKSGDHDWRNGRLPLYMYFRDQALLDAQCEAFSMYMVENGHGAKTVFPSLQRFEDEVVGMALGLFNAPLSAVGTFTSGGTESIMLLVKSVIERARANGLTHPNIVGPVSLHPAFNKGAEMMGATVRRTRLDEHGRADMPALEGAIDANTILLVGSAPAYPHGVFDPLTALGALAVSHGLPLHVDACFGGFLAPFARDIGYPIPVFDFAIPGVTSLSADLHKYGFAPKGASVILYRDPELHAFQGFEFEDWPRGMYRSSTLSGSKPGGALAGAWAIMRHLGRDGYRDLAARTMTAKSQLVAGVNAIVGLSVFAPGELSIFAYKSDQPDLSIDGVAEIMGERGWFVSRTADPRGVHFTVNPVHLQAVTDYLSDLSAAVDIARQTGLKGSFVASTY